MSEKERGSERGRERKREREKEAAREGERERERNLTVRKLDIFILWPLRLSHFMS